jgi:hypothetical protein
VIPVGLPLDEIGIEEITAIVVDTGNEIPLRF